MFRDWSMERMDGTINAKCFATKPTIKLKLITTAYNRKRAKPDISERHQGSTVRYYITPKGKVALRDNDIDKYLKQVETKRWNKYML
jgi:hypothetical protein